MATAPVPHLPPQPIPSATDPAVAPVRDDTPTPLVTDAAPAALSAAELREAADRLRRVLSGESLEAVYGTTDPGPWLSDRRAAELEVVRLYATVPASGADESKP